MIRIVFFQFGNQASYGENFANGYGVNPDRAARGGIGEAGRNTTKALAQAGAVFAVADHAKKPVRKA